MCGENACGENVWMEELTRLDIGDENLKDGTEEDESISDWSGSEICESHRINKHFICNLAEPVTLQLVVVLQTELTNCFQVEFSNCSTWLKLYCC